MMRVVNKVMSMLVLFCKITSALLLKMKHIFLWFHINTLKKNRFNDVICDTFVFENVFAVNKNITNPHITIVHDELNHHLCVFHLEKKILPTKPPNLKRQNPS